MTFKHMDIKKTDSVIFLQLNGLCGYGRGGGYCTFGVGVKSNL